jgi:selenocysteine-specific elongation factor
VILDPQPGNRHKRFADQVLERLETLTEGDPRNILIQILRREGVMYWADLDQSSGLDGNQIAGILEDLISEGIILTFGKEGQKGKRVVLTGVWDKLLSDLYEQLNRYHKAYPLRPGMPMEELKSQSGLPDDVFREAVEHQIKAGLITQRGPDIQDSDFRIRFSESQDKLIQGLMDQFSANPTQPPSVADSKAAIGEDLYQSLVAMGRLKQISPDVVFSPDGYEKMVEAIKGKLTKAETITVAQARDMFGSTRKYMLAFLEHLDQEGLTVRDGDLRRLK